MQFYPVKVKDIIRETADAATVVFDIPENLRPQFGYLPGQYLTLRYFQQGEEVRRAYSFSSSPVLDQDPAVSVKKVDMGRMSGYINDTLKAGDTIEVYPPQGRFTVEVNPANKRHYLLYGGGSGITPMMSILRTVLHSEPESRVSLFYANRNTESIIFWKKLDELVNSSKGRLQVYHNLDEAPAGWKGGSGRPGASSYVLWTREMQGELRGYDEQYYICGPSPMMELVKQGLNSMGIGSEKIHTEYFSQPTDKKPAPAGPVVVTANDFDPNAPVNAVLHISGKTSTIQIPKGSTILEAAKDEDLDPPYACQMGVCTTCRAKLTKGKVHMDEREGLSDAEINAGFILTCQSHPRSNELEMVFE